IALPAPPVPSQLPADIPDVTGRDEQVEYLCDLFAEVPDGDTRTGAVMVSLIAGAGGLGKTTLAVHVAHRLRRRFPDGQLYVNLRGASDQPAAPSDVLARFLRELGVDGTQIPESEDERAALYRTRLAGRRVLIVLDDALEPKYTNWYIPYAGTSMVIAYNQKSRSPSQFKAFADGSKPLSGLFTLLETPGLKLGRTDPNIDPQGRDFIYMLELAQAYYHLPSDTVTKILGGPLASAKASEIYAEASLPSTLQSGQLDASSAFITQAIELHLDYIPLPAAINLSSQGRAAAYAKATITLNNGKTKSGSPQVIDITIIGKPTPAATAFVKYTLSSAGLAQYKAGGF